MANGRWAAVQGAQPSDYLTTSSSNPINKLVLNCLNTSLHDPSFMNPPAPAIAWILFLVPRMRVPRCGCEAFKNSSVTWRLVAMICQEQGRY